MRPLVTIDWPWLVVCDRICSKAWGINSRPKWFYSDDEDDYAFFADDELMVAPTREPVLAHNNWCRSECERSVTSNISDALPRWGLLVPNFVHRIHNLEYRFHLRELKALLLSDCEIV